MTTESTFFADVRSEVSKHCIHSYTEDLGCNSGSDIDSHNISLRFCDTEDESIGYSTDEYDDYREPIGSSHYNNQKGIWLRSFLWRQIIIPLFLFCCSCVNIVNTTLTVIDTEINLLFEYILTTLGFSGHWLNLKMIKKFLIIMLMIFVIVQCRKEETDTFNTNRLFPEYSLVSNYHYGELNLLVKDIQDSEITVVLYYAPWDRESQNFIPHFIQAAQYYHKQVTFSAINCWYPKSECRNKYKLYSYPLIILFLKSNLQSNYLTLSFNGPLSSHHLIRFIRNVLQPYIHIANRQELSDVLIQHQAIVIGYYTSESSNRENMSFYSASIEKLQHEKLSEVKYALVTDLALAHLLDLNAPSDLQLRTKEKVIVFPRNAEKNTQNITHFVLSNLPQLRQWIHISGKKSLALNNLIRKGPTLIIFAPDNPYHNSNELFELMKILALEYYECKAESSKFWSQSKAYKRLRRDLSHWQKDCQRYLDKSYNSFSNSRYSLGYMESSLEDNSCELPNFSKISKFYPPELSESFSWTDMWEIIQTDWLLLSNCGRCSTSSVNLWHQNINNGNFSCKTAAEELSSGPAFDDMIDRLVEEKQRDSCKRLTLGAALSPPLFVSEGNSVVNISGLGCRRNRTLQFAAVDSLLHEDLAEQYGVNFLDSMVTGCIIIDSENEVSFFLNQSLTRSSLTAFIYNYTHNLLDRKIRKSIIPDERPSYDEGVSFLEELNADSYMERTSEVGQAYLVLHYTPHCGACTSIGDILLQCKQVLSNVSRLKIARIDVSKNTLPWHLTFLSVPTLILFPSYKKSETKVFNTSLPLTVKNVMLFLSAVMTEAEQDALRKKLCGSKCRKLLAAQSLLDKIKYYVELKSLKYKLAHCNEKLRNFYKEVTAKYTILAQRSYFYRKIFNIEEKLKQIDNILHTYNIVS